MPKARRHNSFPRTTEVRPEKNAGSESTRLGNHIRRGRFLIRAEQKRAGKLAGKGHYKLV